MMLLLALQLSGKSLLALCLCVHSSVALVVMLGVSWSGIHELHVAINSECAGCIH